QQVFSTLPVDIAASILTHFPYYLQYVLLHTRSANDMRTILQELPSDEKMQFFDELPEEAWQTLAQEIGEIKPESGMSALRVASWPAKQAPPKPVTPSVPKAVALTAVPVPPTLQSKPDKVPSPPVQQASAPAGGAIIEARGVEKSFLQADGHNVQI